MNDPVPTLRQAPSERENQDLKPGGPPRPASEPQGSEGSSENPKTKTDPATGAPQPGDSDTAGAS